MKKWKLYYRRLRRYKIHKIKLPKNRDPNISEKSFMITSDRQIKEYDLLHRIVPEDVPEDDDEIMRIIPKAGGVITPQAENSKPLTAAANSNQK